MHLENICIYCKGALLLYTIRQFPYPCRPTPYLTY